jgi:hypothetical protein
MGEKRYYKLYQRFDAVFWRAAPGAGPSAGRRRAVVSRPQRRFRPPKMRGKSLKYNRQMIKFIRMLKKMLNEPKPSIAFDSASVGSHRGSRDVTACDRRRPAATWHRQSSRDRWTKIFNVF